MAYRAGRGLGITPGARAARPGGEGGSPRRARVVRRLAGLRPGQIRTAVTSMLRYPPSSNVIVFATRMNDPFTPKDPERGS